MSRLTTTPSATVYGARAEGPTAKEAKANAVARIERAFKDEWAFIAPPMTRFPLGHVGLVYRTLDAWEYQVLWADRERLSGFCISRYRTAADAERAMRRDVAQQYIDVLSDHGISVLWDGDAEGRRDHVRTVRFQHAYRRFEAQGLPDVICHRQACEAMGTPEADEAWAA